ncbi:unnamed protein product [Paramecium sonneborni]|uniref:Uncharacterized protein n=1 Tax=Paramecium sonneborni TaxID=65129 RepID=A0A8S1R1F0_9CILI|nr:unnamed protein product [Paramecium sonneborni]
MEEEVKKIYKSQQNQHNIELTTSIFQQIDMQPEFEKKSKRIIKTLKGGYQQSTLRKKVVSSINQIEIKSNCRIWEENKEKEKQLQFKRVIVQSPLNQQNSVILPLQFINQLNFQTLTSTKQLELKSKKNTEMTVKSRRMLITKVIIRRSNQNKYVNNKNSPAINVDVLMKIQIVIKPMYTINMKGYTLRKTDIVRMERELWLV